MELRNEFSVKVPVEEAWAVLTDLERVAPCMPGFQLLEVAGDEYRGEVVVKVGPMTTRYRGVASFQERDAARHRAVVRAEGRETRGQGSARAIVTATLQPEEGGTHVSLLTELTVTGKVAQFGRGLLADVSSRLLRQFVEKLEADVLSGAPAAASAAAAEPPAAAPGAHAPVSGSIAPERSDATPAEPVDLLATAGAPLLKRLVPLVLLLGIALWLLLRG